MRSLVMGIAILFVVAWLLFLPVRLAVQLVRVLHERARISAAAPSDGVEKL